jgi:hypothetical protein
MFMSHACSPSLRGALARLVAVMAAAVLVAPAFVLAGAGGASAQTGAFTDGVYDPQTEYWADIETYGVDADTNRLDLSIGGPDMVDDYYDQDHSLVFRLDTDGDNDTDFSVVANGGTLDGVYAGENSYSSRLCPVTARLSSTGAHVVAATRCVGSPTSVHVAAVLMSGRDSCGFGICRESSFDFAPDEQGSTGGGQYRFSPAVAVTAVPAPAPPVPPVNTTVKLTRVRYDAPGADTKAHRNGEQVLITNTGRSAVTMTGWTLRDASGHLYRFPATRVAGRDTVTVFSGAGANTLRKRFWRSGAHVWNNTGRESATLRDSYGRLVDRCAWTSHPGGVKSC